MRVHARRAAAHAPVAAQVDHGFDGEYVSRLHCALGLVLRVVRHVGGGVEELPDAVPAVGCHDATARGLGHHVDGLADVPADI